MASLDENRAKLSAGAGGRCCKTCACSLVLEPPTIQPPGMTREAFDRMPRQPQRICRWFPPQTIPGVGIMQQPVGDTLVCWQWQEEGTLPGDQITLTCGVGNK